MSQALVRRDDGDPMELGRALYASKLFPDVKSAEQAVVKILAGREFGLGPVAAMSGIHVIDGKPSLGANLLAALVKGSAKYDYKVPRRDAEGCVLDFYEDGRPVGSMSFDKGDATRAGLLGKGNWRKYPRDMYFARCITAGVRTFCPDLLSGVPAYTAEELGDDTPYDDSETVEIVTGTVEPDPAPDGPTEPQEAAQTPAPEGAAATVEAGSQDADTPSPSPLPDATLAELRDLFGQAGWDTATLRWQLVALEVEGPTQTDEQLAAAVRHLSPEQAAELKANLLRNIEGSGVE